MDHQQFIAALELDLVSPPEAVLPLHHMLSVVHREDQRLMHDLELSGNKGWSTPSVPVTADPGTADYLVPVAAKNFGRAQWAERELTNNRRMRVQLSDLQDQAPDWENFAVGNGLGGTPLLDENGRQEIAVYRHEGEVRARILPRVYQSVTFHIFYTEGELSIPVLTASPRSLVKAPAYWDLLHSRCVVELVIYCTHISPDLRQSIQMNHARRLDEPVNGLVARWNRFRRMDTGESDGRVRGFTLGRKRRMWM